MTAPFAWPGRSARGSVVLPLPWSFVPPLAAVLDLAEGPLDRKDELHMTLLSRREAAAVAATLDEREWPAWFARHDWRLRLTDRWCLLHDVEAGRPVRAVIAAIDCDALNAFRRDLGYAAAVVLEDTLPHVTLWVAGTRKGIGLCSTADAAAKTVRTLTAAEREAGIAPARSG
jgi:hypothetical protein